MKRAIAAEGEEVQHELEETARKWARLLSTADQYAIMTADSLEDFPAELLEMIAAANVGTLMSLARTNRVFAAIAANDTVWKLCYARDFPGEYAFCNQELPIFVLGKGRPLNVPDLVDPETPLPWKRFYLHTAEMYRRVSIAFTKKMQAAAPPPPLPPKATAFQIRTWVRKYMFSQAGPLRLGPLQIPRWSMHAHIALIWLCAVMWFLTPEEEEELDANDFVDLGRVLLINHYPWTEPYVLVPSMVFLNAPHTPEAIHAFNQIDVSKLFADQDVERWFDIFLEYRDERDAAVYYYMKRIWSLCQYAVRYPCIFTVARPLIIEMCQRNHQIARILPRPSFTNEELKQQWSSPYEEEHDNFYWYAEQRHLAEFWKPIRIENVDLTVLGFLMGVSKYSIVKDWFITFAGYPRTKTGEIRYIAAAPFICAQCTKTLQGAVKCGADCDSAYYCGQECADRHWQKHKEEFH